MPHAYFETAGVIITLVLLHITCESWQTISNTRPDEMLDNHDAHGTP